MLVLIRIRRWRACKRQLEDEREREKTKTCSRTVSCSSLINVFHLFFSLDWTTDKTSMIEVNIQVDFSPACRIYVYCSIVETDTNEIISVCLFCSFDFRTKENINRLSPCRDSSTCISPLQKKNLRRRIFFLPTDKWLRLSIINIMESVHWLGDGSSTRK